MMTIRTCIALLALLPAAALAQQAPAPDHSTMQMPPDGATQAPAAGGNSALAEIDARMKSDMDMPSSGNVDVEFLRGMVPHHEGAIDMAKVVLASPHDPEVRALAERILAAQEAEIKEMQAMLTRLQASPQN